MKALDYINVHFKQTSYVHFVSPGRATLYHVESNYTILIPGGFHTSPSGTSSMQLFQYVTMHVLRGPAKPRELSTQCKISLWLSGIQ